MLPTITAVALLAFMAGGLAGAYFLFASRLRRIEAERRSRITAPGPRA
jgi:hypothetical protein